MDIFSTRELALFIWIGAFLTWLLAQPKLRPALGGVAKAFTQKLVLASLGLLAAYIAVEVAAMHALGLWSPRQLKDTLIWAVSVAAVSLFAIDQISSDRSYFKNAILDNFKITLVVEFIIGSYTFPLWAELILLPVATFLGALLAYAQTDKKKYHVVAAFLSNLLALLGFGLIAYTAYRLLTDIRSFASLDTAADFALAPLLSLAFLPFLFGMALYVSYERAFLGLRFAIKDPTLRAFARRSAVLSFRLRVELLRRWARNVRAVPPADRKGIKASILEVLSIRARERDPEPVPPEQGWSPFLAVAFLEEQGLAPGDYHRDPYGDGEWYAQSGMLKVGEGLFPSTILYLVEGEERVATKLKLTMHVDADESESSSLPKFLDVAKALYLKALGEEMPEALRKSIAAVTDVETVAGGRRISLVKELRRANRLGGCELKFRIEMEAVERRG